MKQINLELSTQINDGLTQTSADGASLAFDSKYGIMFCAYMSGFQCHYGESRGKIALSYFPASQPTNIRFVTIAEGDDVYCNNIWGLGNGKVRVFYEKYSRAETEHRICYKDFTFPDGTLSEEKTMMLRREDGTLVPLTIHEELHYLEARGFKNHYHNSTEEIGHCAFFKGDDGYVYGAALSEYAEPILYRSTDDAATVEFFAVYPLPAQYEFEYRFLNGIEVFIGIFSYVLYSHSRFDQGRVIACFRSDRIAKKKNVKSLVMVEYRNGFCLAGRVIAIAASGANYDCGANGVVVVNKRCEFTLGLIGEKIYFRNHFFSP